MAVRFLHLSDLHLGSRHEHLGDEAETRRREVMEAFRQAVNVALDPPQAIDAVLICGNLFDSHNPDPETLSFARGLLGRLVAERKPVILIPGYRDACGYRDSTYRTERWPGVDVISTTNPDNPVTYTIRGQDVHFHGSAMQVGTGGEAFAGFEKAVHEEHDMAPLDSGDLSLEEPQDLVIGSEGPPQLMAAHIADPGIHVGLICAGLPDHPERDLRSAVPALDPRSLAGSEMDYVALGGYHGFATYELEGTTAAYPGTPVGRRFQTGDAGSKSLLVVDVDRGDVQFSRVPVSGARLEDWTIDLEKESITDPDALTSALLARSAPDVIAQVTLVGRLEFHCDLDDVAAKVSPRFRYLELLDRTDLLGSSLLRRVQGEHTIRGFFVRRMIEKITDLEERARSADPDAAVHRDIAVARRALKIGLEQFLDEEPAKDVLGTSAEEMPQDRSPQAAERSMEGEA